MELYSYKYSIPYLVFLGYLFVLMAIEFHNINRQQSTKDVRLFTMMGFLFFFGLRGFVNWDWYVYYPFFENLPTVWSGEIFQASSRMDVGFVVYSILVKSICPNYFFWIFISTLIDVACLNVIFKKYAKYYVVAVIAFIMFSCEVEMDLMRNIKSLLLFIISIKYLQERKMWPYMLLNIGGILFHFSSVCYLPLYFLLHREFSKRWFWALFIGGNIIYLLHIEYIRPVFLFIADLTGSGNILDRLFYLNTGHWGLNVRYIERLITFVFVMSCYKKLKQQNATNIIMLNAYMLYCICFFYFSEAMVISQRLSTLFVFSYWILYHNLFSVIQKKINMQIIVLLFVVASMVKVARNHTAVLYKYDNVLFGIESYEKRKIIFEKYSPLILLRK